MKGTWLNDTWHEFKIVGLVFLGILVPTTILLMTPAPKEAVLWISFVVAIILPSLALHWKGLQKKIHHKVRRGVSGAPVIHRDTTKGRFGKTQNLHIYGIIVTTTSTVYSTEYDMSYKLPSIQKEKTGQPKFYADKNMHSTSTYAVGIQ